MPNKLMGLVMVLFGLIVAPVAWAEPSVTQVTQAIQSGRLDQAQNMMQEVLKAHPHSAEAQYLEAQVLARQGQWSGAAAALQKAEQLAPGMPFVKPQILQKFQKEVKSHQSGAQQTAAAKKGTWGSALVFFIGLILLIAVIAMFLRRRRQNAQLMYRGGPVQGPFAGMNGGYGPGGPGSGYPHGPMGGMPQQGGGLGSSLASGIATGVGVGAGLAAGQALAGSLFGDHGAAGSQGNTGDNDSLGLTNNSWDDDQLASNDDFGMDDGGDGWG
ncbi:hypothetical protein B1757_11695 [Acidithiobacillus marinus]|uniref:Uncharacterized protein n=1 Tax=Acidithiobacillus marinus TaxID=187490 RepID=A0A2I1DJ98_9PROT|nr:tetratricopeptide repeat protein [Acidithiobacillus marinus]PKY09954.1 hypothetical protein B1757_11695 [Acidithiobacillus marinus]